MPGFSCTPFVCTAGELEGRTRAHRRVHAWTWDSIITPASVRSLSSIAGASSLQPGIVLPFRSWSCEVWHRLLCDSNEPIDTSYSAMGEELNLAANAQPPLPCVHRAMYKRHSCRDVSQRIDGHYSSARALFFTALFFPPARRELAVACKYVRVHKYLKGINTVHTVSYEDARWAGTVYMLACQTFHSPQINIIKIDGRRDWGKESDRDAHASIKSFLVLPGQTLTYAKDRAMAQGAHQPTLRCMHGTRVEGEI